MTNPMLYQPIVGKLELTPGDNYVYEVGYFAKEGDLLVWNSTGRPSVPGHSVVSWAPLPAAHTFVEVTHDLYTTNYVYP